LVLLRKSNPKKHNLQAAAYLGVIFQEAIAVKSKIFISVLFFVMALPALACLHFIEPELVSVPEPEWFGFQPKVSSASVVADISISEHGGVTSARIVSVAPEGLPEAPLKSVIRMARFLPARHKTPDEEHWTTGTHEMRFEFEISW
jgi:hypothetical protein